MCTLYQRHQHKQPAPQIQEWEAGGGRKTGTRVAQALAMPSNPLCVAMLMPTSLLMRCLQASWCRRCLQPCIRVLSQDAAARRGLRSRQQDRYPSSKQVFRHLTSACGHWWGVRIGYGRNVRRCVHALCFCHRPRQQGAPFCRQVAGVVQASCQGREQVMSQAY